MKAGKETRESPDDVRARAGRSARLCVRSAGVRAETSGRLGTAPASLLLRGRRAPRRVLRRIGLPSRPSERVSDKPGSVPSVDTRA